MGGTFLRGGITAALLVLLVAATASAKSYSADRFDATVRVLADGALDVTERVVFRFEDGTFTEVFREIPTRRTDAIEVVSASLQGVTLPFGTESGTAEVRRRNARVRVIWRFRPTEGVTREFVLNYRVRGVIRQDPSGDLLVWRATPGEHRYRIASSTIAFELPEPTSQPPVVTVRRASLPRVATAGTSVTIETDDIGRNGWVDTALTFPRGSVVDAAPRWQQRANEIAAGSMTWIVAAGVMASAGIVVLIAWRQSYDAPQDAEGPREARQPSRPDDLAPAIAGVLVANGRSGVEQALAALFSMAEHGDVEISELPRRTLGQRDFQVTYRPRSGALSAIDEAVLETIFREVPRQPQSVLLSKARSRLSLRSRAFARAMDRALTSHGFIDAGRKAIRDRYSAAALWLAATGAIGFAPAALLVGQHGGWPLLLPVAVLVLALASVLFAATVTPLSNDGVRRARRWRDYRHHLRTVADGKQPMAALQSSMLPFAIGFGLAGAWSKLLRRQGHAAPAWFHALEHNDAGAFAAYVGANAATASGAGGGSGAAGGGSSGAS